MRTNPKKNHPTSINNIETTKSPPPPKQNNKSNNSNNLLNTLKDGFGFGVGSSIAHHSIDALINTNKDKPNEDNKEINLKIEQQLTTEKCNELLHFYYSSNCQNNMDTKLENHCRYFLEELKVCNKKNM
jgi:hypothetical protein